MLTSRLLPALVYLVSSLDRTAAAYNEIMGIRARSDTRSFSALPDLRSDFDLSQMGVLRNGGFARPTGSQRMVDGGFVKQRNQCGYVVLVIVHERLVLEILKVEEQDGGPMISATLFPPSCSGKGSTRTSFTCIRIGGLVVLGLM
jgi:hypothetical protein